MDGTALVSLLALGGLVRDAVGYVSFQFVPSDRLSLVHPHYILNLSIAKS